MKKFLFGLVGLMVVVVAVLLVGPGLWDWNGYKPEILERIKAETGREMAIDGDLSLAVLPSPRLAVAGVRIAIGIPDADGFKHVERNGRQAIHHGFPVGHVALVGGQDHVEPIGQMLQNGFGIQIGMMMLMLGCALYLPFCGRSARHTGWI